MAYVYLLRDPRKQNWARSIFYVGKATGMRPTDHLTDAKRLIDHALTELNEERSRAGNARDRTALSEKISCIYEIHASRKQVAIEVIAGKEQAPLSHPDAFKIEAGIIAALRMTELGNKVAGSGVRPVPHSLFANAAKAKQRSLPTGCKAVVVPVKGLWGGANYAGSMIAANDKAVWNNARRLWTPFAQDIADDIAARAGGPDPALLIAIDSHPLPNRTNIVVGVYQLRKALATSEVKGYRGPDGAKKPYFGWKLMRTRLALELPTTAHIRKKLVGRRCCRCNPDCPSVARMTIAGTGRRRCSRRWRSRPGR